MFLQCQALLSLDASASWGHFGAFCVRYTKGHKWKQLTLTVLNMTTSYSVHEMSWFHPFSLSARLKKHHNTVRGSYSAYLVRTWIHTEVTVHIHYGDTGAPGVWAGPIYTPYADRGLCMSILQRVYTESDWHTASRALYLMSSAIKMTDLKALEGRWGVSYSGDHYPQLLYVDVVAASSICPFWPVYVLFLLSVLFICIHREILEDNRAPVAWWEIEIHRAGL